MPSPVPIASAAPRRLLGKYEGGGAAFSLKLGAILSALARFDLGLVSKLAGGPEAGRLASCLVSVFAYALLLLGTLPYSLTFFLSRGR